jgi:transcriptional regulator with XRE-family HTH domain
MQRDGITKYRISKTVGCSATTVANWLSGTAPTGEYLQKLSEMFGVSVDYLLGNEEKPAPESRNGLSIKEQKDIAKKVDAFMASLENEKDLMFDGDPASDEALEDLRRAITVGYEMARIKNREKYNPYKNKNKK